MSASSFVRINISEAKDPAEEDEESSDVNANNLPTSQSQAIFGEIDEKQLEIKARATRRTKSVPIDDNNLAAPRKPKDDADFPNIWISRLSSVHSIPLQIYHEFQSYVTFLSPTHLKNP